MPSWLLLGLTLAAPEVPEGAVFTPSLRVEKSDSARAGTAFAITHDKAPVILTALHLAGPGGGFERQLTAAEVPYAVTLELADWKTGAALGQTDRGRRTADVPYDPTGNTLHGDLMAFDPPNSGKKKKKRKKAPEPAGTALTPLALDPRCPEPGETLWLVGPASVQEGTVLDCRPWALTLQVGDDFEAQATSGAPWVDAEGQVVGMSLRSGELDGARFATGIPGSSLAARLAGEPVAMPLGNEEPAWRWIDNPWGVDLVGLHATLLPRWGLSGSDEDAIREATLRIPGLGALFAEFSKLAWASSAQNFDALNALLEQWNGIYADAGVPLRSHIGVGRGNAMAFMTQEVLGEVREAERSARLVVRLDTVNIAESAVAWNLDGTGEVRPRTVRDEAALVLGTLEEGSPLHDELVEVLGPEHAAVLLEAAGPWATLLEARTGVNSRSTCSRVALPRIPWDGLSDELGVQLEGLVGTGRCPGVLQAELDALRQGTAALRAIEGYDDALAALLVHALRPHAVLALTQADSVAERHDRGIGRALRDAPSKHLARALFCGETAARPPAVCDKELPAPESFSLEGLPETLPLTWGGR